jgi:hypothetical protein
LSVEGDQDNEAVESVELVTTRWSGAVGATASWGGGGGESLRATAAKDPTAPRAVQQTRRRAIRFVKGVSMR